MLALVESRELVVDADPETDGVLDGVGDEIGDDAGERHHADGGDELVLEQLTPAAVEQPVADRVHRFVGEQPEQDRPDEAADEMDGELITRHCTSSSSETYHGDQWVTVEIRVHGSRQIEHVIDGKVVLSYSEPQLDERDAHARELAQKNGRQLTGGTISLQSESHPVEFRKVELLNLVGCMDKKARSYRPYFEEDDPSACVYE